MDQLVDDNEYKGIGCIIPVENIEFLKTEYPDLFKLVAEGVYKHQLIGSHTISESEVLDRIDERKEADRLEVEKSVSIWEKHPNHQITKKNGGD